MCNKGNSLPKFCKLQEFLFHMHDLVHSLSVDFKHHDIDIKISMCLHFRFFQKVCLRQENAQKRNLACSMIKISKNATPMALLLVVDLQCNYEKHEYQDFIPKQWWSAIPAQSVWMSEYYYKRHFQVSIKNSYSPFGYKYSLKLIQNWSLFQIYKFTKRIQSTVSNKIHIMDIISIFTFQEKVNKMCFHWKWNLSNETLKTH